MSQYVRLFALVPKKDNQGQIVNLMQAVEIIPIRDQDIEDLKANYKDVHSIPAYYSPGHGVWPTPSDGVLICTEISPASV